VTDRIVDHFAEATVFPYHVPAEALRKSFEFVRVQREGGFKGL
jgi:hypothetical protein